MPSKTNGILFSQLENYVNSSFISESKFNLIYNYIDSQRYFRERKLYIQIRLPIFRLFLLENDTKTYK